MKAAITRPRLAGNRLSLGERANAAMISGIMNRLAVKQYCIVATSYPA